MNRHLTLFHAPYSRSAGVRFLLEEIGADYEVHTLNLKTVQQREPDYLAVNPMGKVPAIRHGDTLVTEQAAVYMYVAELYPEADLAPAIGDPLRGPYFRWMVFYGSCFEPALIDKYMGREAASAALSPYGDFDTMFTTLSRQLEQGPYLLGERFSAADVLWGTALAWTTAFKMVPELPVIAAYIARVHDRPAAARAKGLDEALAEEL